MAPVLAVGRDPDADVRVSDIRIDDALHARFHIDTPWGAGELALGVRGEHQVVNGAQAATVALHLGVPFAGVAEALASARGSYWRMELIDTGWGLRVLNDAYNASPVATVAALDVLAALEVPGRRVAVLGDMRELGALSGPEHARVGAAAAASGVELVIAVGSETGPLADAARAAGCSVAVVADAASGAACALELVRSGDAVLVKGSRALGLEVVVEALVAAGEHA